jgi:hypothetical protein
MHWLLLVGGQACHPGGQKVNRITIQNCQNSHLGESTESAFETIYGIKQEFGPPLPEMGTWALGFQVRERKNIDKVLQLMQRRLERLDICVYDNFFEDEPKGNQFNALSYDKCKSWIETVSEYLLDSDDFDEDGGEEIPLFSFSDRPAEFPKPKVPVFSGEVSSIPI